MPSPTTDPPTARRLPGSTAGRHVLVVDDASAVRDVATRALTRHGFRVTSLPDARHALDVLDRTPGGIAVVVSDLHMPGMNGVQLAERIRDRHPSTAFVLMSGLVTRQLHALADRIGIDRVIAKPFRLQDLARTVSAVTAEPIGTEPSTE